MSETDERSASSPVRLGCIAALLLVVVLLGSFLSLPLVQPRGYVVAGRVQSPSSLHSDKFVETYIGPGKLHGRPVAVYALRLGRWYWGVQVPTTVKPRGGE